MAQVEILWTHVKTRWILWPVINPVSKWLARTVKMVYSGLCKRPHLDISCEELLKEIISLPHWATLMCTHMHTYMTIYTVHNSICNKQCKLHSCNYSFSNIMQQQFKQYLHCLRCYKSLRGDLKNMGRCVWILRKSYVILTENIWTLKVIVSVEQGARTHLSQIPKGDNMVTFQGTRSQGSVSSEWDTEQLL